MKWFSALKPFDFGAIGVGLSLTVLSAVLVYTETSVQTRVRITGPGEQWLFSLDRAEIITVPGSLGDTVVEVRDGKVRVLASPCANQTCVSAGTIQSHGQWIACLPNQVLVIIEGAHDEELDAAIW